MKQFIKDKKVTYNLMSYTGYKALVMFSLLLESPKSFNEVCDYFAQHPYLREKISIDTFRVYMNSLRRIGCEIKRFRDENKESKYTIVKHPFELSIDSEQIQSVLKIYKSVVKNISIKEILAMESFFEKINQYMEDNSFIDEIKRISMLKDINKDILKTLIYCCENKETVVLLYNSPNSGNKDIEIVADKVEVCNNKIYLYGTSLEYKQYSKFVLSRILAVKEIRTGKDISIEQEKLEVIYELKNCEFSLDTNETLLLQNDDLVRIEAITTNKFLLKQRLLEYGPFCKIVSPEEFKLEFINLLNEMKERYHCG